MKANSFKEVKIRKVKTIPLSIKGKVCSITGKEKLWEKIAIKRASLSDDIKGGMVAYKCPHGRSHWHVGHTPFAQNKVSQ